MNIFIPSFSVTVSPVAVYWEQDGAHCQIFQTQDIAFNFYLENNLSEYNASIWTETGQKIPPPETLPSRT